MVFGLIFKHAAASVAVSCEAAESKRSKIKQCLATRRFQAQKLFVVQKREINLNTAVFKLIEVKQKITRFCLLPLLNISCC